MWIEYNGCSFCCVSYLTSFHTFSLFKTVGDKFLLSSPLNLSFSELLNEFDLELDGVNGKPDFILLSIS